MPRRRDGVLIYNKKGGGWGFEVMEMLEEREERSFSPFAIGLFLAIVVAAAVGILVQYRNHQAAKTTWAEEGAALQEKVDKLLKENGLLQQKVEELEADSKATVNKLQRELQSRVSQLKSTESASATKDNQIKKIKADMESQQAQAKKDADAKAQEIKRLQDQAAKLQQDVKNARSEADRTSRELTALKTKVTALTEGEQEAQNLMIQQLAEAKRQLKQEQAARKRLEEELDALRQQMLAPQ